MKLFTCKSIGQLLNYPDMNNSSLYHFTAGQHPLPFEAQEVQAVQASIRAYNQRWFYCQQRYGERGLNFQSSDLGYLVTLTAYQQSYVNQQVLWLANVLAGRGIPTFYLFESIRLLYRALCQHQPQRAYAYEKLSHAANLLEQERRRIFSDQQLESLLTVSLPDENGLPGREALIVLLYAIADEKNGRQGTLANVRSWLLDPQYFSRSWRQTLADTLQRAWAMT